MWKDAPGKGPTLTCSKLKPGDVRVPPAEKNWSKPWNHRLLTKGKLANEEHTHTHTIRKEAKETQNITHKAIEEPKAAQRKQKNPTKTHGNDLEATGKESHSGRVESRRIPQFQVAQTDTHLLKQPRLNPAQAMIHTTSESTKTGTIGMLNLNGTGRTTHMPG